MDVAAVVEDAAADVADVAAVAADADADQIVEKGPGNGLAGTFFCSNSKT